MRAVVLTAALVVSCVVGLPGRQPQPMVFTFEGQVLDEQGAAASGADVHITGPGLDARVTAGPDGKFTLVSVISDIRCLLSGTTPDGRYGLSRRADGPRVFWQFVSDIQQMACMASGRNCACGAPG